MHVLAAYVKQNAGGGEGGELLTDLSSFLKAFACSADGPLRALGGEFISRVNALDWGASAKCPRVLNAC